MIRSFQFCKAYSGDEGVFERAAHACRTNVVTAQAGLKPAPSVSAARADGRVRSISMAGTNGGGRMLGGRPRRRTEAGNRARRAAPPRPRSAHHRGPASRQTRACTHDRMDRVSMSSVDPQLDVERRQPLLGLRAQPRCRRARPTAPGPTSSAVSRPGAPDSSSRARPTRRRSVLDAGESHGSLGSSTRTGSAGRRSPSYRYGPRPPLRMRRKNCRARPLTPVSPRQNGQKA